MDTRTSPEGDIPGRPRHPLIVELRVALTLATIMAVLAVLPRVLPHPLPPPAVAVATPGPLEIAAAVVLTAVVGVAIVMGGRRTGATR